MTSPAHRCARPVSRGGLFAAALLGLLAGCGSEVSTAARTAVADRGTVEVRLRTKGTVEARNFTRIHSELEMEAKIIQLAEEGSTVKEGDLLVKFDPTELTRSVETSQMSLDQALIELEAAQTEFAIQKTDAANQIARAQLDLDQARQELEKYEQGDAPIQKRRLQIALEEAESELTRKEEKFRQMPALLEEGFVTNSQVEEERIGLEKAKVAADTARRELENHIKYGFPMEQARKKAAVMQADSELETARKRTDSQIKQRQAELRARENRVRELRQDLVELGEKIGKTVILAPTGGLVIYGEPEERRRRNDEEIKVGTRVWPQMTIITLPDLSEMTVSFRIHEADITKIREGMEGVVLVESSGMKPFHGKVHRIADLANTGGWRSDPEVKQFDVEMLLAGNELGLRPGVSAQVEIVAARKDQALRVPVSSVHGQPGSWSVFVETPGGFERRSVQLGLADEHHVEVLEGIAEGAVLLLGPAPAGAPAPGPRARAEDPPGGEPRPQRPAAKGPPGGKGAGKGRDRASR